MVRQLRQFPLAVLVIAALASSCGDCQSTEDKPTPDTGEAQTTFESEKAPYSVTLPEGWGIDDSGSLNPHADLAITRNDRHFLIVIPQELPSVDGVEPPDAEALKDASLERMRENVDNLEIEQEGPVSLENGEGTSLFAEGVVDQNRVQYVATFVTHAGWGYQIIAWGPAKDESKLIDSVDAFIGGWQFRDDSQSGRSADAGPTSATEQ